MSTWCWLSDVRQLRGETGKEGSCRQSPGRAALPRLLSHVRQLCGGAAKRGAVARARRTPPAAVAPCDDSPVRPHLPHASSCETRPGATTPVEGLRAATEPGRGNAKHARRATSMHLTPTRHEHTCIMDVTRKTTQEPSWTTPPATTPEHPPPTSGSPPRPLWTRRSEPFTSGATRTRPSLAGPGGAPSHVRQRLVAEELRRSRGSLLPCRPWAGRRRTCDSGSPPAPQIPAVLSLVALDRGGQSPSLLRGSSRSGWRRPQAPSASITSAAARSASASQRLKSPCGAPG